MLKNNQTTAPLPQRSAFSSEGIELTQHLSRRGNNGSMGLSVYEKRSKELQQVQLSAQDVRAQWWWVNAHLGPDWMTQDGGDGTFATTGVNEQVSAGEDKHINNSLLVHW